MADAEQVDHQMCAEIDLVVRRNQLVDGAIAGPEFAGRAKEAESARIVPRDVIRIVLCCVCDVPLREGQIRPHFGEAIIRHAVDLGTRLRIDHRLDHRTAGIGCTAAADADIDRRRRQEDSQRHQRPFDLTEFPHGTSTI